ncbi:MAG: hypothetical protein J1E64_14315 [Acetatifactor sp.]|nr:hypothetical protein [Acetatifactor sp.]
MGTKESQGYEIEYDFILDHYSIEDLQKRFGVWYSDAKKFIEKKDCQIMHKLTADV